jgi:hypothetical protein
MLQLHWKGPVLPLTFKDKQGLVDMYSLNAREVLKSYIPSAVKKCLFYSLSHEDFLDNISLLTVYLQGKYPLNWWRGKLTKYAKYRLPRTGVG